MKKLKYKIRRTFLEILAKKNWSQNGFAQSAHLTSGHLSQLVNGRRNASARTRIKILQALNEGNTQEFKFEHIFSKLRS